MWKFKKTDKKNKQIKRIKRIRQMRRVVRWGGHRQAHTKAAGVKKNEKKTETTILYRGHGWGISQWDIDNNPAPLTRSRVGTFAVGYKQ